MELHRHYKNTIAILVIFIAMGRDQYENEHLRWGFSVSAFQPVPRRISKMKTVITGKYPFNDPKAVISESLRATTSNTILFMAPGYKNKNNIKNKEDNGKDGSSVFWRDLAKKPGNLIIIPFVALFGIDLLLNIIFITKRSIEYFVFGQAPSTETW